MDALVLAFCLVFGFALCLLGIVWKGFKVLLRLTEYIKQVI
jgi:hypothetical protein